jgi:hypothetical protein
MLSYRAALPLSRQTLTFTAGLIRRHRAWTGSVWRKLNAGQQALPVLVHLRKGEPFAQVAAGFGVGTTTAWRYVTETVALLAARAPKLRQAVRAATKAGLPFVVLDGTLARTDRVAADRPFFSGKHHCHGMNLQVLAGSTGQLPWVSGALPGSVRDMKAAWIRGIEDELAAADLAALADKGYPGAAHAKTPYKGRKNQNPRKKPPRPRETPRTRGKSKRPAQSMEDLDPATLLPLAGRPDRQSHPRPASPRDQYRMKKAQCGFDSRHPLQRKGPGRRGFPNAGPSVV